MNLPPKLLDDPSWHIAMNYNFLFERKRGYLMMERYHNKLGQIISGQDSILLLPSKAIDLEHQISGSFVGT